MTTRSTREQQVKSCHGYIWRSKPIIGHRVSSLQHQLIQSFAITERYYSLARTKGTVNSRARQPNTSEWLVAFVCTTPASATPRDPWPRKVRHRWRIKIFITICRRTRTSVRPFCAWSMSSLPLATLSPVVNHRGTRMERGNRRCGRHASPKGEIVTGRRPTPCSLVGRHLLFLFPLGVTSSTPCNVEGDLYTPAVYL